jgi:hypothetical protein
VELVGSVLVRNEDVFLERAIRNAAGFCDRIHVLDHMSNDGTPAILRSLADPGSGAEGRPNLNELRGYRRGFLGRLRRAIRRPALDPRVTELHRQGLSWKQATYRRGERATFDATPFRLRAQAG